MQHIHTHIQTLCADVAHPQILLGLSGGPDSVFLFYALLALHEQDLLTMHALHINHEWRESAAHDEAFCADLCARHGITLVREKARTWAHSVPPHKQHSGSKEADAREVRRIIFAHYRQTLGCDYVALAHHANDQIETFFIRLIRGAGLTGLCGMHEKEDGIIRPLLGMFKQDIIAWLAQNNKAFCLDETNDAPEFLRNRIRAQLIPALTQCDQRALSSLTRTIQHLQQEDAVMEEITTATLHHLQEEDGRYAIAPLMSCLPALRARVLTQLLIMHGIPFTPSEGFFAEIGRFLSSPRGGRHVIALGWAIEKQRQTFCLIKIS